MSARLRAGRFNRKRRARVCGTRFAESASAIAYRFAAGAGTNGQRPEAKGEKKAVPEELGYRKRGLRVRGDTPGDERRLPDGLLQLGRLGRS